MKNNKSNISSKSSMGKYRRRGFTACCILILCLCCFTSTAFATSGLIDDDQLRHKPFKIPFGCLRCKVGDITEHGIVTAIDENGYFFKIDESEAVVTPMSTFNGSLTGLFDSETTLNDSAFYFGGQAVCKNLAGGAGAVQFKLGDTAVGVPPGSGYSFVYVWGNKDLFVQSIEVWGTRTVTWEIIE